MKATKDDHSGEKDHAAGVTHGNHGEDGVDDAGSDGGVDGLLHSGRLEDARGVVEHLRDKRSYS